jgi:hypothetical protein
LYTFTILWFQVCVGRAGLCSTTDANFLWWHLTFSVSWLQIAFCDSVALWIKCRLTLPVFLCVL